MTSDSISTRLARIREVKDLLQELERVRPACYNADCIVCPARRKTYDSAIASLDAISAYIQQLEEKLRTETARAVQLEQHYQREATRVWTCGKQIVELEATLEKARIWVEEIWEDGPGALGGWEDRTIGNLKQLRALLSRHADKDES